MNASDADGDRHRPDAAIRDDLRPFLPESFFRRSPSRLNYLAAAVAAAAAHLALTSAVLKGLAAPGWWLVTLAAAVYTYPYFMLTMHELEHGAVLPKGAARELASWAAGFVLPFQPRFWRTLHLHHHTHTNQTDDTHRMRTVDEAGFASQFLDFRYGNAVSYLSSLFAVQFIYCYSLYRFLTGTVQYHISRTRVLLDLVLHAALGAAFVAILGWRLALIGLVPLYVLGNALLNAYMISQHLTRPMVDGPDSLRTSVSVWLWRGYSHMDFGRHGEHHLYPAVSADKLREVAALLRERHRASFREKSLAAALGELFSLPGHYRGPNVLTDRRGITSRQID
jgi:fatty acid desaturase